MALTLSVGFVVDDAIVMLVDIVRHMEMGQVWRGPPRVSRNHSFTIMSMTLSLARLIYFVSSAESLAASTTNRVTHRRRCWCRALSLTPHAHALQPLPAAASAQRDGRLFRPLRKCTSGFFQATTSESS